IYPLYPPYLFLYRGGSGIGRAVCSRLAREGASVAVADLHEAGAQGTLRGLPAGDHQAWTLDVGSAGSVAALMAHIQTHFSRPPNVCVNCAGITMDEFLLRQKEEAFDAVLRNALDLGKKIHPVHPPGNNAQWLLTGGKEIGGKAEVFWPHHEETGKLGEDHDAGEMEGKRKRGRPRVRWMDSILEGTGFVRVIFSAAVGQVTEGFDPFPSLSLKDVADVCAFLASEESRYITGASIEVTGGVPRRGLAL
uniref:Uncharacterized protein n=1 Tax=Anolis carolinensis TaxID=28377 RepID=A0A803TYU5_ANOCA